MEGENAHPNRSPAVQSLHRTHSHSKAQAYGTVAHVAHVATSLEASPLPRFDPYQDASSSGSSSYSHRKSQRNRVGAGAGGGILRDGERMESLFGLHKQSTAEYWQLCRTVTDASTRCPSLENHTHRGAPCSCLSELAAWRRILEICSLDDSASETGGVNLLRLHRRATARLAPFLTYEPTESGSSSASGTATTATQGDSSRETQLLRDHLLHIWLSFAAAQRRYGKVDEARWTLRHLHTLQIGVTSASFYLAQAHVAETDEAARDIIQAGIRNNAEPASDLSRALRHWNNQIATTRSNATTQSKNANNNSNAPTAKRLRTELDYRPLEDLAKTNFKTERSTMVNDNNAGIPDTDMSLETEAPTLNAETSEAVKPTSLKKYSVTTKPLTRFELPPRINGIRSHAAHEKFELPSLGGTSLVSRPKIWASSLSPHLPGAKADESTGTPTDVKPEHPRPFISGNVPSNINATTDARIETKSPGLPTSSVPLANNPPLSEGKGGDNQPSKGLDLATRKQGLPNPYPLLHSSGGTPSTKFADVLAQRPNTTIKGHIGTHSSSQRPPLQLKSFRLGKAERIDQSTLILDPDDVDVAISTIRNDMDKTPPVKPSKSVKLDLDYMWNWDPAKRMVTTSTETPSADEHNREGLTPSISLSSTSVNVSTSTNSSSCTKETSASENSGATRASQCQGKCDIPSLTPQPNADGSQKPTASTASREKAVMQPEPTVDAALQVNAEFLPLVREQNMLRVNKIPYAKLRIIGKGGSCKVYCALSQTLDVVAIKRVKLDGLDEKATAGYSNEIALLKRLQGNSTIIQLHDSEVDYERRAIHLVMELGEVDLNHVLQKQQTSRGLNMNFIRMTWQQMLKAVHSIHEERIIHGDLKPANFLFVRGSLKLIDFGIAKAMQNDDTTNIYRENQIGTLNYMSPEAILDSGASADGQSMKCGRASDIWSLGCILYQMIYGKTPFADLHMILKLQAIVNPSHQIKYPSGVDESAIDAVKRCLQRNPSDRSPIIHDEVGLLNAHVFLNGSSK